MKLGEKKNNYNYLEKLLLKASNNPLFKSTICRLALAYIDWEPIKLIEARAIFSMLDANGGDRVLDVACGYGQTCVTLAKRGSHVCGYDIDSNCIAIARILADGRGDINFEVGNAEELPYEPDSFDKVVSVCAVEHFHDGEKALEQMYKALKPGGVLVLSVDSFTYKGIKQKFKENHKKLWSVEHYYSEPQLTEKLEKAGFEVEQAKYLINSPLSAFVFELHNTSQNRFKFLLLNMLLPLTYTLATSSDHWFGRKDEGYLLAVKARKPVKHKEVREECS